MRNKLSAEKNELFRIVDNIIIVIKAIQSITYNGEKKMAKYTQEVKDQAVAAVKSGVSFKVIQSTLGPNPKAVMRYLAKAGIDYTELKNSLKESGKLQPATKNQKTEKAKAKVSAKVAKVEVIDEDE